MIIDLSTRAKQRLALMFRIIAIVVRSLCSSLRSRSELVLENMVLRQQVLPVLLRRLDFIDVRSRHGPMEQGKDLLA